jgi:hypothetical protein
VDEYPAGDASGVRSIWGRLYAHDAAALDTRLDAMALRCATGIRATSINAAPTRSGRSSVAAFFGHVGKSVAGTYMPVIVCTSGSP